jgi:hypothetical protein
MEERERRQRYDLNGNIILSKVGEGVFIVRGKKEPFETRFLHPTGVKSAPPASVPDRPVHSPVKPGQHRSIRHTARRHRPCTEQAGEGEGSNGAHAGKAGYYVGLGPGPPPEHQIGWGPVPVPDRPVQRPAHWGSRRVGRPLRRTRTRTPTRTQIRLGPGGCTGQDGVEPGAAGR